MFQNTSLSEPRRGAASTILSPLTASCNTTDREVNNASRCASRPQPHGTRLSHPPHALPSPVMETIRYGSVRFVEGSTYFAADV
ncbi:hypothetical protein E2C01_002036 [Portunus trituberculatus]|uniref:Uncharacterized protein n=1 Tax=Portunus trituberculatus TaxID=210409 RepID=A0A5B7CL20_PORTR|nr:hypothetical protein [Portunus trituberculatus]